MIKQFLAILERYRDALEFTQFYTRARAGKEPEADLIREAVGLEIEEMLALLDVMEGKLLKPWEQ